MQNKLNLFVCFFFLVVHSQTSCFGGLPDVTEHSNHHQIAHREQSATATTTNSEALDVGIHQKTQLSSIRESPLPTPTHSIAHSKEPVESNKLNKKCCLCICMTIVLMTSCVLAGIFLVQWLLTEEISEARESHDQRMKIVHRLLRETPLIGMYIT